MTKELAAEVLRYDGVELQIRVGLNSGDVIVGEIGSGPGRYTAIGHPVGMAQRMEAGGPSRAESCARFPRLVSSRTPPGSVPSRTSPSKAPTRPCLLDSSLRWSPTGLWWAATKA